MVSCALPRSAGRAGSCPPASQRWPSPARVEGQHLSPTCPLPIGAAPPATCQDRACRPSRGFALLEGMIRPLATCPGASPPCAHAAGFLPSPISAEFRAFPGQPFDPDAHVEVAGVAHGVRPGQMELVGSANCRAAFPPQASEWTAHALPDCRGCSGGVDGGEDALDRVGGYELASVVAHGEWSQVVQAWDPHSERPVAIKTMAAPWAHADDCERVLREMVLLSRLGEQRHVLGLWDVVVAGDQVGLVLPPAPSSVQRQAASTPLSEAQVVQWAWGALQGLGALHENGLVHGQVSARHLLLDASGEVQLADLAAARPRPAASGAGEEQDGTDDDRKASATTCRLPCRLPRLRRQLTSLLVTSPVRGGARGDEGHAQCQQTGDVWALGSVLATLLSLAGDGRGDVVGLGLRVVGHQHRAGASQAATLQALHKVWPHASPPLLSLLVGLLHPDPMARLTVAQALQHECFAGRGRGAGAQGQGPVWGPQDEALVQALPHMTPQARRQVVVQQARLAAERAREQRAARQHA